MFAVIHNKINTPNIIINSNFRQKQPHYLLTFDQMLDIQSHPLPYLLTKHLLFKVSITLVSKLERAPISTNK